MVVAGKVTNQAVRAARQNVAEAAGPFDHVLLTVKGYDTLDALEQLEPVLQPGTILGSFQNGVGNEEAIVSAAVDQALLAGSLTLPVSMDEPGKVQQGRHCGCPGFSRGQRGTAGPKARRRRLCRPPLLGLSRNEMVEIAAEHPG